MSVVIPGNAKEEEDAKEVGHGGVHHCFKVTDIVGIGWADRRVQGRTAQVHRVTGWMRLAMGQEKCIKVRDREQNKRQTQETVIQVDFSMCDATSRQGAVST